VYNLIFLNYFIISDVFFSREIFFLAFFPHKSIVFLEDFSFLKTNLEEFVEKNAKFRQKSAKIEFPEENFQPGYFFIRSYYQYLKQIL